MNTHRCAAQTAPSTAPSYTPTMTLDVVSVRESKPDPVAGFMVGGGFAGATSSLKMTNLTVQSLILAAYRLNRHHLEGLPDWTVRPMYNVQGKADEATDAKLATLTKEQLQLEQSHMLQAMLMDRFHLQTHWETRQQPTLKLVVAKGGPKLSPAGSLQVTPEEVRLYAPGKVPEVHQRGNGQRGYELVGHSAHMTSLARVASVLTGTDVTDTTW
ncbi:MAG: TIGR03435 family protein, partial [Terriglobus sp.]